MACNNLEERLEVIRNQRQLILKRIENETDEELIQILWGDFRELAKEEKECLKNLGVEINDL